MIKNIFRISLLLSLVVNFHALARGKSIKRIPKAPPKESSAGSVSTQDLSGDFITEKRTDGTTVKYKKKTTYDFEGANIEGLYNKPSGSYISNIKDVKGKSIIRIRENFDAEVMDSARLIK